MNFKIRNLILWIGVISLIIFLFGIGPRSQSPLSQGNFTSKLDSGKGEVWPEAFVADGFDFPVGAPDAEGYYNAQKFGENKHLGDDWNATSGGNSDLGHPIYSTANGQVSHSYNAGGAWGNIVRIIHRNPNGKKIESLYAHCKERFVKKGDWVKRGEKIASIGNANGAYFAHLHFEIRDICDLELGPGYSSNTNGYLSPTEFILSNRPKKN